MTSYDQLKIKLRVFLTDRTVATITYSIKKDDGNLSDTIIVGSYDKEW